MLAKNATIFRITGTDLIKSIAEKTGITQLCAGSVLEVITKETTAALVRGESVDIHGLAKFKVEHNPAKNVVKVTAAKALNDAVN